MKTTESKQSRFVIKPLPMYKGDIVPKYISKTNIKVPKTNIKDPPDKIKVEKKSVNIRSDIYNGLCIVHAHYEGLVDSDTQFDIQSENQYSPKENIKLADVQMNYQNVRPNVSPESDRFSSDAKQVVTSDNSDNSTNSDNYSLSDDIEKDSADELSADDIDELQQNIEQLNININDNIKDKIENYDVDSNMNPREINDVSFDFIHDFNNIQPEKFRTMRGAGFVKKILGTYYVVTCNHIFVKYARYKGFCLNINNIIVELDMKIHSRIPELDIVILTILSPITIPLTTISSDTDICEIYQKYKNNSIVTGEYIPVSLKKSETSDILQSKVDYVDIQINNNINMIFEQLTSKHIHHIPILNIPVEELIPVKKFVRDYKLDLHNELKEYTKRRDFISRTIAEKVAGLSGSLVRSGGKNIGMICLYTDTNNGLFIKAIPMFLINIVVENTIIRNVKNLMGIQIDTHPCTIDYETECIMGHYVVRDTCSYVNGKKLFNFTEGDIVLEVNGSVFNDKKMIWCDIMNMYVPLNTYMMIRSNIDPHSPITIKIAKQISNDIKSRSYNIMCIPYNNMYRTRITERVCCWRNMIFMELSEDVLLFYKRLGIDIVDTSGCFDKYSNNNEKIVILFNYNNQVPNKLIQTKTYTDMVQKGTTGLNFFYTLNYIGQKKITNMDDLILVISTLKKQKKTTLKLFNDIGSVKLLKIDLL
jgi:hypothetical protein